MGVLILVVMPGETAWVVPAVRIHRLDLDHIRPEIGEDQSAERPGEVPRQIDNPHAVQRTPP